MLLLRLLLVAALAFVTVSAEENDVSLEITDEDESAFIGFASLLLRIQWESDKAEALENVINIFRGKNTNITVIAHEDIDPFAFNHKRIELHLPPNLNKKESSEESDENKSNQDLQDQETITELMSMAKTIYDASEMDLSVFSAEYLDGYLSGKTFINKDVVYNQEDNFFGFYNFTTIVNETEIHTILKQFKDNIIPPTLVHLDVDGKLVEKDSQFPALNAFIAVTPEISNIPDHIVKNAIHLYSKYGWMYSDEELPKNLAISLNKLIPEYKFLVFDVDAKFSFDADYSFNLRYYAQNPNDVSVLVFKK